MASIAKLAVGTLAVTHRERLDRPAELALHDGRNGTGIEASREEHPQRHVAHQPQADCLLEPLAALADPRGVVTRFAGLRRGNLPKLADFGCCVLASDIE